MLSATWHPWRRCIPKLYLTWVSILASWRLALVAADSPYHESVRLHILRLVTSLSHQRFDCPCVACVVRALQQGSVSWLRGTLPSELLVDPTTAQAFRLCEHVTLGLKRPCVSGASIHGSIFMLHGTSLSKLLIDPTTKFICNSWGM